MPVIARELQCPATMDCLDRVQDTLAELWTAVAVADVDRMLFETALVEVVGNLVEHARTPDGHPVTITAQLAVHPDRLVARFTDDGIAPGLDLNAPTEPVDDFAEGGRGLALAQAVSEVTHTRAAGRNAWTVTRYREPGGRPSGPAAG